MSDDEWDLLVARVAHEIWIIENNGEWWHDEEALKIFFEEARRLRDLVLPLENRTGVR